MQDANALIDRLRKGEPFKRGAEAFLTPAGTPDPAALEQLGEAIRTTAEPGRESLIRLLAAIGREADPLRPSGGNLVRDPAVIALLVTPSLAIPGGGRDHALDTLEASVPALLLAPHHEALVKDLEERPGTAAFHVVAKAKPRDARAKVEAVAASPRWSSEEAAAVAKAALGDTAIEQRFAEAFVATREPKEKMRLAGVLGRIGTAGALAALASELRTDVVYEMPGALRRSVRLEIVAALSKSFPEEKSLWDNAIVSDEGYARVEVFVEARFGLTWKTARPPYLTIQGFPSP